MEVSDIYLRANTEWQLDTRLLCVDALDGLIICHDALVTSLLVTPQSMLVQYMLVICHVLPRKLHWHCFLLFNWLHFCPFTTRFSINYNILAFCFHFYSQVTVERKSSFDIVMFSQ